MSKTSAAADSPVYELASLARHVMPQRRLYALAVLELNDASVAEARNDDVYELVTDVAATDVDLETIATRLRLLVTQTTRTRR